MVRVCRVNVQACVPFFSVGQPSDTLLTLQAPGSFVPSHALSAALPDPPPCSGSALLLKPMLTPVTVTNPGSEQCGARL